MRLLRTLRWLAFAALIAGSGPGGGSPADAALLAVPQDHANVGNALAVATAGDTVLVSSGTYAEHALTLPAGVTLRARPGATVILDADGLGRHLDVAAGDTGTVIESIQFHAGVADDRSGPDGGSLRVAADANLTVRGCSFENSAALHYGGAIFGGRGVTLKLEQCRFQTSRAFRRLPANKIRRPRLARASLSNGGVIYLAGDAQLTASDCRFVDSVAKDNGGAVFLGKRGSAVFTDCEFEEGEAHKGGALWAESCNVDLTRCSFRRFVATSTFRGPSIGGAMRIIGDGELRLTTCELSGNRAEQGGAMAARRLTRIVVDNCHFFGNSAESGGAMQSGDSPLEVTNSVFVGNNADAGGAVAASGHRAAFHGCTFRANTAGRSGSAIMGNGPATVLMDRCIVAFHPGSATLAIGSETTVECSCTNLFGNAGGDWTGGLAAQAGLRDNFSVDPRFAKDDGGALADDSPCLKTRNCGRVGAGEGAGA